MANLIPQSRNVKFYRKWLGVKNPEPLTLFDILGVRDGETDANVISTAARNRNREVRKHSIGARQKVAEEILNDIAFAEATLLDPKKRKNYLQKMSAPNVSNAKTEADAQTPVFHEVASVNVPRNPYEGAPKEANSNNISYLPFVVVTALVALFTSGVLGYLYFSSNQVEQSKSAAGPAEVSLPDEELSKPKPAVIPQVKVETKSIKRTIAVPELVDAYVGHVLNHQLVVEPVSDSFSFELVGDKPGKAFVNTDGVLSWLPSNDFAGRHIRFGIRATAKGEQPLETELVVRVQRSLDIKIEKENIVFNEAGTIAWIPFKVEQLIEKDFPYHLSVESKSIGCTVRPELQQIIWERTPENQGKLDFMLVAKNSERENLRYAESRLMTSVKQVDQSSNKESLLFPSEPSDVFVPTTSGNASAARNVLPISFTASKKFMHIECGPKGNAVWQAALPVKPNSSYEFEWTAKADGENLSVEIFGGDGRIGAAAVPASEKWKHGKLQFNSGSNTNVLVSYSVSNTAITQNSYIAPHMFRQMEAKKAPEAKLTYLENKFWRIDQVGFSPDKRLFAALGVVGERWGGQSVFIWDVESGEEVFEFGDGENSIHAFSFSPTSESMYLGIQSSILELSLASDWDGSKKHDYKKSRGRWGLKEDFKGVERLVAQITSHSYSARFKLSKDRQRAYQFYVASGGRFRVRNLDGKEGEFTMRDLKTPKSSTLKGRISNLYKNNFYERRAKATHVVIDEKLERCFVYHHLCLYGFNLPLPLNSKSIAPSDQPIDASLGLFYWPDRQRLTAIGLDSIVEISQDDLAAQHQRMKNNFLSSRSAMAIDGQLVIQGSEAGTLQVRDLVNEKEFRISAFRSGITAVATTLDGESIAAGSQNGEILLTKLNGDWPNCFEHFVNDDENFEEATIKTAKIREDTQLCLHGISADKLRGYSEKLFESGAIPVCSATTISSLERQLKVPVRICNVFPLSSFFLLGVF